MVAGPGGGGAARGADSGSPTRPSSGARGRQAKPATQRSQPAELALALDAAPPKLRPSLSMPTPPTSQQPAHAAAAGKQARDAEARGAAQPRRRNTSQALLAVLPSASVSAIVAIEGEREAAEFGPDATTAGWYVRNQGRPLLLRVVHPNSDFRRTWDALTALVALCMVWQVPLHIVFEWWLPQLETVNALSAALELPQLLLHWLATAWFAADMLLSLRTGYITGAGVLIMDDGKIALRYLCRWFLIDLLGTLPLEALFPEDHALSYLGPYACKKAGKHGPRSADNALFYCERQLGLRGKLRNVRRVLAALPVPRLVLAAKEQKQLLPTLLALPTTVRRVARLISFVKRLKWFKLGRVLQAFRLWRALWAQFKYAYFSAQKRLRANQLRRKHLRELRRAERDARRAASVPARARAAGALPTRPGWLSPERVKSVGSAIADSAAKAASASAAAVRGAAASAAASAAAVRGAAASAAAARSSGRPPAKRRVNATRAASDEGPVGNRAAADDGASGPPARGWPPRLWRPRSANAASSSGGAASGAGAAAGGGSALWQRRLWPRPAGAPPAAAAAAGARAGGATRGAAAEHLAAAGRPEPSVSVSKDGPRGARAGRGRSRDGGDGGDGGVSDEDAGDEAEVFLTPMQRLRSATLSAAASGAARGRAAWPTGERHPRIQLAAVEAPACGGDSPLHTPPLWLQAESRRAPAWGSVGDGAVAVDANLGARRAGAGESVPAIAADASVPESSSMSTSFSDTEPEASEHALAVSAASGRARANHGANHPTVY